MLPKKLRFELFDCRIVNSSGVSMGTWGDLLPPSATKPEFGKASFGRSGWGPQNGIGVRLIASHGLHSSGCPSEP